VASGASWPRPQQTACVTADIQRAGRFNETRVGLTLAWENTCRDKRARPGTCSIPFQHSVAQPRVARNQTAAAWSLDRQQLRRAPALFRARALTRRH
jgi:hypothetical protein